MNQLKDWEISKIYDSVGVFEIGRKVSEEIRSSEPSRRVRSNGKNVCVRYPSRKMGVIIQAESHTVELPCVYQLEHEKPIIEYYDQPKAIKLKYKSKNGRNLGVMHTADYFEIRNDYIGYIECKTEQDLEILSNKSPNRYIRDSDGMWRCPPGEQSAAEMGLSYRIWSDKGINWTLYSNLVFLEDYMCETFPGVRNEQIELITKVIKQKKCISLKDLVSMEKINTDSVYALILEEKIYFNLEVDRLADVHDTNVYINNTYAQAYTKLNSINIESSHYTNPKIVLEPGQYIIWDSVKWKILNVGAKEIILSSNDGNTIPLNKEIFYQMVLDGDIVTGSSNDENDLAQKRLSVITSASPNAIEKANKCLDIIKPILKNDIRICDIKNYSERTLFRWIAKYREAECEYGQGYLGLIESTSKKGNRKNRLSDDLENLIDQVISKRHENNKQSSVKMTFDRLKLLCEEKGIICPCEKTFRKRVKSRPKDNQVMKREGKRAASNYEKIYWRLDRKTPVHGERPFQIAHIDHTELDIELISKSTGENLGRPWLTIMVDTYTRRIIAFYLTFSSPSYVSCMMVIRECVKKYGMLPQIIILDNGKEFESIAFETLLASYEVTKKSRPPAKSRFGAVCERLFGTTNTELIYGLIGNTQITKKVRIMTKSVNPKNLALWNLSALTYLLTEYFYEIYELDVHPALRDSPRNAHEKGVEFYGERRHMIIPYTEDFIIRTLPSTPKGTAKVNYTTGMQLNYIRYWHELFRDPDVEGKNIPVKYDPDNVGIVYAYVKNHWVQCISEYNAIFNGRTRAEVSSVTKELRQENKSTRKLKDINAHRIAFFLEKAEASEAILEEKKRNIDIENSENVELLFEKPSSKYPLDKNIADKQKMVYEDEDNVIIMEDF